MLQRNAGAQLSPGTAGPGRLESQMGVARPVAGTNAASENAATVGGGQYLIFSLLDLEFALPAESVQGVERLADVTSVPHVAFWVAGVINLRGSICSVVDLRAFLDMERLPYNPRTRLLSVKSNEMSVCLVVDSVSEMVPIQPGAIDSNVRGIPRWVATYSSGVAAVGKRRIILLDASRLLFSEKMLHYSV
jgi:purine-binding chemotaxis protein CheW